ncbi:thiamine phosphate synthase [Xylanibacter oryzae]|uniref:thiamine phosphate synthase n=1 Tax=Xylanibacter oryzae TaxID=185293 RepID=UPI0004B65CFA|nr:thiamine phosphate synthase [Xylanibacter oryzae]MBP7358113.1 thiamine phosphate synthase [Prevotella sp.]
MKLIIMTKSTFFVEEDKILSAMFDEGLENLHLYKSGAAPIYSERLLSLLPDDCYNKITVHDHYYLKSEYGLKGIHIDDPNAPNPENYKGNISRTCLSIDSIKETKKKSDYIFLKNIFDCIEFKDEKANFTMNELKDAAKNGLIDKRVYALGGIDIDNIKIAKDLGFGGVVVCGDLWNKFDIHNGMNYKEIISHFEKLRKAIG